MHGLVLKLRLNEAYQTLSYAYVLLHVDVFYNYKTPTEKVLILPTGACQFHKVLWNHVLSHAITPPLETTPREI